MAERNNQEPAWFQDVSSLIVSSINQSDPEDATDENQRSRFFQRPASSHLQYPIPSTACAAAHAMCVGGDDVDASWCHEGGKDQVPPHLVSFHMLRGNPNQWDSLVKRYSEFVEFVLFNSLWSWNRELGVENIFRTAVGWNSSNQISSIYTWILDMGWEWMIWVKM